MTRMQETPSAASGGSLQMKGVMGSLLPDTSSCSGRWVWKEGKEGAKARQGKAGW